MTDGSARLAGPEEMLRVTAVGEPWSKMIWVRRGSGVAVEQIPGCSNL